MYPLKNTHFYRVKPSCIEEEGKYDATGKYCWGLQALREGRESNIAVEGRQIELNFDAIVKFRLTEKMRETRTAGVNKQNVDLSKTCSRGTQLSGYGVRKTIYVHDENLPL